MPIPESDLKIDTSDTITKEEIDFLKPSDPLIVLMGKINGIAEESRKNGIPLVGKIFDLTLPIGSYLEGYLNNFDPLPLLVRNLFQLIDRNEKNNIFRLETPSSKEDQSICVDLPFVLKNTGAIFEDIDALLSTYQQNAPETKFKKQLTGEYFSFKRNYEERKVYKDIKAQNQKMQEKVKEINKKALSEYQSNKFLAAKNLFLESLKLCIQCYLKGSDELAITFHNTGRSFQKAEQPKEAEFFLQIALDLRKDSKSSNQKQIEKAESALNECRSSIKSMNGNDTLKQCKN